MRTGTSSINERLEQITGNALDQLCELARDEDACDSHAADLLENIANNNLRVGMVRAYPKHVLGRGGEFTVADAERLAAMVRDPRIEGMRARLLFLAAPSLERSNFSLSEAERIAPMIAVVPAEKKEGIGTQLADTDELVRAFVRATSSCVSDVVTAVRVARAFVSDYARMRFLEAYMSKLGLANPAEALCVILQIKGDGQDGSREFYELVRAACRKAGFEFDPDAFAPKKGERSELDLGGLLEALGNGDGMPHMHGNMGAIGDLVAHLARASGL